MAELVDRPAKRRRLVVSSSASEEEDNGRMDRKTQPKLATWNRTLVETSPLQPQLPATPDTPFIPRSTSPGDDLVSVVSETGCDAAYQQRGFVHVPRLSLPEATFHGWQPPSHIVTEWSVLTELSSKISRSNDGTRYIELQYFTIYRPEGSRRGVEMCALDRLQALRADELCFSGYLAIGNEKYFVHNISFRVLAVDGYGDFDCYSVHDKMCIQSTGARCYDVWYRLGRPSAEYKAFYEPFLWLATFTKFFVDCLLQEPSVSLNHFRSNFAARLCGEYGQFTRFRLWHEQCGSRKDFRTAVAAYVGFLYKESHSINDITTNLFRHPVWSEAHPETFHAITQQPVLKGEPTVVTPSAYRCFRGMYFSSHLAIKRPVASIIAKIAERKRELCLTPWDTAKTRRPVPDLKQQTLDIGQGDVVCIQPDTDSAWKTSTSAHWFAYVQRIREEETGDKVLDVLWLYESSDTTLGASHYPFQNELFLSDICDCGKTAIPIEDVVAKLDISWFVSDPCSVDGFFIRQRYHAKEEEDLYSFTSLASTDFCCAHTQQLEQHSNISTIYRAGDTVLVRPRDTADPDALLEPARVIRFDPETQKYDMRNMLRRADLDHAAPLNELEEGCDALLVRSSRIIRRCKIATFASRCNVAAPYNRDGTGDYFYLLDSGLHPESSLATPPESASEYEDASYHGETPLIGLGLYCGGGNFDRGLEEGGAVNFKYAVEWEPAAIHSYRANVSDPDAVQYFLGSVNDYLARAMYGSKGAVIASFGHIDLISAGSPCPGFSNMQPNKQSESSFQYASMVASVVAFVDCYNPQYLVLENVVSMASTMVVGGREYNVFRQILAALVSLGCQVQQFLMDAWSFGSPQKRSRIFIVASAPGSTPLSAPPITHAHPPGQLNRSLGKTVNGLSFGQRRDDYTPFPHISARQSCADLPAIGDSLVQICPKFPDHRISCEGNPTVLQRLVRIPIHPHGMGIRQAVTQSRITSGEAYEWFKKCSSIRAKKDSKSYSRIRPDEPFPTIMTYFVLACGKNGRFMHWNEHRGISILEARRAQGFLDHEMIVGTPAQQFKIVGNSVDRKVAFAMGLVVKESLDATRRSTRQMLQGDDLEEQSTRADGELERILDGRLQPSPAQLESMQREVIRQRSEALAGIIQSLREKRQVKGEEHLQPPEWAIEVMDVDGSPRWSGDSPADTIAVRRRTSELETAIRPHRRHASYVDLT